MLGALMRVFSLCWKPLVTNAGDGEDGGGGGGNEGRDGLLWYRETGKYAFGEFSLAVIQPNQVLEDQIQIESGAFVGVYDGHGGPETARYVWRSIADVRMKHTRFNKDPIAVKFRLPEPMNMPIMTANPSIITLHLQPYDSFVIVASDGLWEHLSNEKVVDIVHNHPRAGTAKRLIKAALQEAAR